MFMTSAAFCGRGRGWGVEVLFIVNMLVDIASEGMASWRLGVLLRLEQYTQAHTHMAVHTYMIPGPVVIMCEKRRRAFEPPDGVVLTLRW